MVSMAEENTYADADPRIETLQPNKRKRESLDHDAPRAAPQEPRRNHDTMSEQTFTGDDQDFANALTQHNDNATSFSHALHQNGNTNAGSAADTASAALHVQMNVPQPTELSFQTQTSGSDTDRPLSSSFNINDHGPHHHALPDFDTGYMKANPSVGDDGSPTAGGMNKPQVGSEEWHKVRRDNHKEGNITTGRDLLPYASFRQENSLLERDKDLSAWFSQESTRISLFPPSSTSTPSSSRNISSSSSSPEIHSSLTQLASEAMEEITAPDTSTNMDTKKLSHNAVERRRRETINEGINELAKIVPGCEKNKGSILQRAVQFITQLKENESQNIEKWTLEKLLTEQAIAELSSSCDKLKAELANAWSEAEKYKKLAKDNGFDDGEEGKEAEVDQA